MKGKHLMHDEKSLSMSRLLIIVFVLGFILRLVWLSYSRPVPVIDFEHYRRLGEALLEHHQFGYPEATAYRLPLYPAFLAALMLVSRDVLWLSLWNVLFSSLLILLVYSLALRITGGDRLVSLFASLFCAFNPSFVFYSPVLGSEHLFSVLIVAGFILSLSANIRLVVRAAIAGILLGLAILTRGEAVFYIPVFMMSLYFTTVEERFKINSQVVLLVGCLVIIFPWYIRNSLLFDKGVGLSTSAGINFYFAHNKDHYGYHEPKPAEFQGADEFKANRLGIKLGMKYIINHPKENLLKVLKGTVFLYYPTEYAVIYNALVRGKSTNHVERRPLCGEDVFSFVAKGFYVYLLVMSTLALVFFRRIPLKSWLVILGIIFMNWFCYCVVFFSHWRFRYRYMTEMVFCILAGFLLANLFRSAVRDEQGDPSPENQVK